MSIGPTNPQYSYTSPSYPHSGAPSSSSPSWSSPYGNSSYSTYSGNSSSLPSQLAADPDIEQLFNELTPTEQQEIISMLNADLSDTPPPVQRKNTTVSSDSTSSQPTPTPISTGSIAPIGAASAGANDPSITVKNTSSTPRFYSIEASAGSDPENLNQKTFELQPGQSVQVNPGAGFNGAITDHGSNPNSGGSRNELNFTSGGKTWYDTDLELGNTNVTLGPTNTGLLADDGRASLVGNNLSAYHTHGAVAGQAESAADKASDLGTHVISTQQMTLTST